MSRYIDADIAKNLILNDMAQAEREGKDLNGYTDALFHLKTIPTANVAPIADTVRKMHSMIKEQCIKGGIYPAFVARTIDQIAKEMLEGNTE